MEPWSKASRDPLRRAGWQMGIEQDFWIRFGVVFEMEH